MNLNILGPENAQFYSFQRTYLLVYLLAAGLFNF